MRIASSFRLIQLLQKISSLSLVDCGMTKKAEGPSALLSSAFSTHSRAKLPVSSNTAVHNNI